MDANRTGVKYVAPELHPNWGHASANHLKQISATAEGANERLLARADEVVNQREVCQALEKAPHLPVAGSSPVLTFDEKIQVDLPFLIGNIL